MVDHHPGNQHGIAACLLTVLAPGTFFASHRALTVGVMALAARAIATVYYTS